MSTQANITLSDVRIMILYEYSLPTEESGHQHYAGDGVRKNREEAYVWYRVAKCADNNKMDSLFNRLNTKLIRTKRLKLSSRARRIYVKALGFANAAAARVVSQFGPRVTSIE